MKISSVILFIAAVAVSACTAPDDYAGEVSAYNGKFLTITGAMNQISGKPGFSPTPAMQVKAEETCGGPATFQGTVDSNPTNDEFINSLYIGYNFLCK